MKKQKIKKIKNQKIKNKHVQLTGKSRLTKSQLNLHSRFHAHQFQYFGSKGILQLCLRFDLCHSQANASLFTEFLKAYDQQLNSAEHQYAQKKSEERDEQHVRLSRQIFQIRLKLKQGTCLQSLLAEGKMLYEVMSEEQKAMVDLCASGYYDDKEQRFVTSLEQQMKVLQQQQEPRGKKYASAGSAAAMLIPETAILLENNESGNTYKPEPRSFNLLGKGKSKKGKGKGKSKK
jgi:hypothetical protein